MFNQMANGTTVMALCVIEDEGEVVAVGGDLGLVVEDEFEYPTVHWSRTGKTTIVDPYFEITMES